MNRPPVEQANELMRRLIKKDAEIKRAERNRKRINRLTSWATRHDQGLQNLRKAYNRELQRLRDLLNTYEISHSDVIDGEAFMADEKLHVAKRCKTNMRTVD